MKIKDLFNLYQGNGYELISMSISENSQINFVSRTAQDNGVVAQVDKYNNIEPFKSGLITVALGGSVLSSFVQLKPFYTAFHVMALEPKREMSLNEKLYYCMCIQSNAYKYNYGRQANKTLKNIEIPDVIPGWVYSTKIAPITTKIRKQSIPTNTNAWKEFILEELFYIKYGVNLELSNCRIVDNNSEGINFVARTANNNGVVAKVQLIDGIKPQEAGLITCAGGGSVLSTFVQNEEFYSGRDLYILKPKQSLNIYQKLFCCQCIEINAYKYAYGRQANKTLKTLRIKLPAKFDGTPDWDYMEQYIKSLHYSDKI